MKPKVLKRLMIAMLLACSMGIQMMPVYGENLDGKATGDPSASSSAVFNNEGAVYETDKQDSQFAAPGAETADDLKSDENSDNGSEMPADKQDSGTDEETEKQETETNGSDTETTDESKSDGNNSNGSALSVDRKDSGTASDTQKKEKSPAASAAAEQEQTSSDGKTELTNNDNSNKSELQGSRVLKSAGQTITLDLSGGTLTDVSGSGWTCGTDEKYYYTISEDSSEQLSLPIPTREGYIFGGWKKDDDTVVAYNTDSGTYTLDLSEVDGNLAFTAVWQQVTQQYTIDITKAVYTLPFKDGDNTVKLTHYNIGGKEPDVELEIIPFLNDYVNTLTLEYTISYSDDNAAQKEIKRTNVELKDIKWDSQNEDFNEVISYLSSEFNGATKNVYLNEYYLRNLIADYESSYTGTDKISGISQNSIEFNETYKNTTALKLELGSSYNYKNTDSKISGTEKYMIDTVSPSNVQVNLFDYWQLSPFYYDRNSDTGNVDQFFTSKVNKEHGLVFFKNAPGGVGTWNTWTNAGGDVRKGIVKNKLDELGFPQLNLKETFKANGVFNGQYNYNPEESLQYLFDPETINNGDYRYGRAYSNVKGLFKINEDGNYYYSSHQNFAEYDYQKNCFNVYNTWGVAKGGTSPNGQFFPFNTADQVFNLDRNDQLVQQSGLSSTNNAIDHYLGLSMAVNFQQPIDGMVSVGKNAKPMTFEFSGDDDVWIFIDGVLVADLGGIHDEASVEIDFSTGEITKYLSADPSLNRSTTTLKAIFGAAGKTGVAFNGETFAGNTNHTLQMFYLERGNYDSNLTLSFNLMEPVDSQIVKLDQDGNPVENANFALYEAELDEDGQPILNDDKVTYKTVEQPIASSLTSNKKGQITIPSNYDFSQHTYYVLRETAPNGYFGPGDVLLRYDKYEKHPDGTSSGTNLLLVENRWTTGAVGNFSAKIYQSGDLHYDGDTSDGDTSLINQGTGKNGLILAVPMMKGSDGNWSPLYGSNMAGFETVSDTNSQKAALKAILYQIFGAKYGEATTAGYSYGFQKWYMEWNEDTDRYEGVLNDLPGDATQYYWASGEADADMSVDYYFLDLEKLKRVFGDDNITEKTGEDKLTSIADTIQSKAGSSTDETAITNAVNTIVDQIIKENSENSDKTFGLLDVSLFNRTFASRIYVPNTQPDLRVRKLDQDGNAIPNVQFGLFSDENCNGQAIASGKTDSEGLLVFSETADSTSTFGKVHMNFEGGKTYFLKEIGSLDGYDQIDKFIPVYVTVDGRVYADALKENDGITVRKGLGKLVQTMAKYAGDGSIDGTLRDITGKLFTVGSFNDIENAIQANTGDQNGEELDFCYGATNAILEYGTHQINGVYPNPYFEVDEGIAGIIVHQNYDAHQGDALYDTYANKTRLDNVNIRALFTGSTTVVVRNRQSGSQGSFSIKKTVSGTNANNDQMFDFDVTIEKNNSSTTISPNQDYAYTVKDENNSNLEIGIMKFTGVEQSGWKISNMTLTDNSPSQYFSNGRIQLKAKETITVTGIPFGLKVTAQETDESANGYRTSVSVNNGQWSLNTTQASGIVEKPVGNPFFVFNNHKDKVTDLELKKIVSTQEDKAFTFTITLDTASGEDLTGSYKWQKFGADENPLTDANCNGTIDNGSISVSLKHNEKLVIYGLPIGSKYVITENTMGYTPSVTVNGEKKQVVNGSVSGTIEEIKEDNQLSPVKVVYTNVRSGSITITKRDGTGGILNGAGFTLYSVSGGEEQIVRSEQTTALAVRITINPNDEKFDNTVMRYNDGNTSYIVHSTQNGNGYFYYRFLTEAEITQYYAGKFPDSDNVEAIVQFDGITDFSSTYKIVETKVPDGYVQSEDIIGIELPKADGNTDYYDLLYTVTNHKEMVLPTSGLNGIAPMLGAGIVLVGIAFVLWKLNKNRAI